MKEIETYETIKTNQKAITRRFYSTPKRCQENTP